MAMTFAVKDRVPTYHLRTDDIKHAVNVHPRHLIPTPHDMLMIKSKMHRIVTEILATHLTAFHGIQLKEEPHEFWQEMQQRSEVVSVIISDVVDIRRWLISEKYDTNWSLWRVLLSDAYMRHCWNNCCHRPVLCCYMIHVWCHDAIKKIDSWLSPITSFTQFWIKYDITHNAHHVTLHIPHRSPRCCIIRP